MNIILVPVSIIVLCVINICLVWRTERLKTAISILSHNQRILIHKVEGTKDE
jgi:hypothetical protein